MKFESTHFSIVFQKMLSLARGLGIGIKLNVQRDLSKT